MLKHDSLHFIVYFFYMFFFSMVHSDIALRIEDYEEYFKQKHADSNCGFAEEYEVHMRNTNMYFFFIII